MDRPARGQVASGWTNVHRLKWVGVILPVAFIGTLELIRFTVVETDTTRQAGHIALAATTILAVVAFAILMFCFIERAQRQVIRQNRELAAVNAVSTAVQGELGVDVIIDAALASVIESTGATEASRDGLRARTASRPARAAWSGVCVATESRSSRTPDMLADVPHLIDIPLSTGTSGRRPDAPPPARPAPPSRTCWPSADPPEHRPPAGLLDPDRPARRPISTGARSEGHGLYDVLLRISNQDALADTSPPWWATPARCVDGDEAVHVPERADGSRSVQLDGSLAGMTSLGDGTVCISAMPTGSTTSTSDRSPVRSGRHPRIGPASEIPIPAPRGIARRPLDGPVRRTSRTPSATDASSMTLVGLASIAITVARMRENERQGAIVAERERIAREMHDSLAQVLGVTHLRLRRSCGWPEVGAGAPGRRRSCSTSPSSTEEAYRDVREAILGLRESSRRRSRPRRQPPRLPREVQPPVGGQGHPRDERSTRARALARGRRSR